MRKVLPPRAGAYGIEKILVAYAVDQCDPIDRIFVIPTDDFGMRDFHIFSEKDNVYAHYYVKDDEIERTILHLARKLGINAKVKSE